MTPGERAEALIARFSISDPRDIDMEAIALDAGVEVEYHQLSGCEATLVGVGDQAIATIKPSSISGRERFSIAHELGHWELHRGKSFRCRVDDPGDNLASDKALEKDADSFAAHLLMPSNLFLPAVMALGNPGFREIDSLAQQFDTSRLATCIRIAEVNTLPVLLACYTQRGLRWFKASTDIPRRWWLKRQLDEDSFAYDLVFQVKQPGAARKQSASVWFDNDDADEYEVSEHCVQSKAGEVLVLIYLSTNMFYAKFDPGVGNRKYNDHGSYVPRRVR
ncbi:MAG: hypothetical protein BroJett020_22310 [Bacteroidota bacterium]|nr:MAG: hypothetical protein BroJett020_22310 [Bacteroidota bacterium]